MWRYAAIAFVAAFIGAATGYSYGHSVASNHDPVGDLIRSLPVSDDGGSSIERSITELEE